MASRPRPPVTAVGWASMTRPTLCGANSSVAFRRPAQHHVEFGRMLADLRSFHGHEVNGNRIAGLWVADGAIDAVARIAGMALDVALRSQQLLAALLDLEVDVRCAYRVG